MIVSSRNFSVALTFWLCAILTPSLHAQSSVDKTYTFKVFLEDEEIGQQNFVVSSNETDTKVEIDAHFKVKYLFITAYSYRHTNTEVWSGECLQMIRSQTNDNGEIFFVKGTRIDKHMKLVTHAGTRNLEGCIKTFAYWDRDFLSSQSLLNSQTGEVNQINVKNLGEDVISVRNTFTPTTHYQIEAEKLSIDLWYSPVGEWLALESTTANESRLRYELQ